MLLVCKCVPTNSRGEACDTGAVDILVKLKDPRSQDAHVIEIQEESKQFMSEFFERVGLPLRRDEFVAARNALRCSIANSCACRAAGGTAACGATTAREKRGLFIITRF